MTPNKRDLKAYSRFDGTGRIVPGSTVLRRQKPKVGKWIETQAYECCNVDQITIVVAVEDSFPFSYPDFVVQNDDASPYMYLLNSGGNVTVNSFEELAAYNNSRYYFLGSFKVVDGALLYTPNATIAALFAANGSTELVAYSFAD